MKHKYRVSISFSATVEAEDQPQAIYMTVSSLWNFQQVQNLSTRIVGQIPDDPTTAVKEAPYADQVRVEAEG